MMPYELDLFDSRDLGMSRVGQLVSIENHERLLIYLVGLIKF